MKNKLMGWSGLVLPVLALSPLVAKAATGFCSSGLADLDTIEWIICRAAGILSIIVPIIIVIAVIIFIWGVVQYVIADDEEAKAKGRDRMIYGIVGFAVIIAMWGLVYILMNTFNLNGFPTDNPELPTVNY